MSSPLLTARMALPTSYNETLGALLVGSLLHTALWGVTCVQTYNYFVAIRNTDRTMFRLLIGFMWCLSTLDTILGAHTLYHYMVINYAKPFALLVPTWSLILRVATTALSNFIIRVLFSHRVYRLSKGNLIVTGWILSVSACSFAVGIALTVKAFSISIFPQLMIYAHLLYVMFAVSTAADLSITVVLFWLLRCSRSGYTKTDGVIRILMMYTVNTGVVVAVDATVALATYIAMPNNFVFISVYLLLAKLYYNAYLSTLNAREMLREKADSSMQMSSVSQSRRAAGFGQVESQSSSNRYIISKPSTTPMAISVQTLVDTKIDVHSPTSPHTYYAHAI